MEEIIKHLEDRLDLQVELWVKMYPEIPFPHDVVCNRAGYRQAIIDMKQFIKQKKGK